MRQEPIFKRNRRTARSLIILADNGDALTIPISTCASFRSAKKFPSDPAHRGEVRSTISTRFVSFNLVATSVHPL
jgi:hypothetical protein